MPSQQSAAADKEKKSYEGDPRKCEICGGWGHSKFRCPTKNAEKDDSFVPSEKLCSECGGRKHMAKHHILGAWDPSKQGKGGGKGGESEKPPAKGGGKGGNAGSATPRSPRNPPKECFEFKKSGKCKFGEKCKFMHGENDKRFSGANPKQRNVAEEEHAAEEDDQSLAEVVQSRQRVCASPCCECGGRTDVRQRVLSIADEPPVQRAMVERKVKNVDFDRLLLPAIAEPPLLASRGLRGWRRRV